MHSRTQQTDPLHKQIPQMEAVFQHVRVNDICIDIKNKSMTFTACHSQPLTCEKPRKSHRQGMTISLVYIIGNVTLE